MSMSPLTRATPRCALLPNSTTSTSTTASSSSARLSTAAKPANEDAPTEISGGASESLGDFEGLPLQAVNANARRGTDAHEMSFLICTHNSLRYTLTGLPWYVLVMQES